MIGAGAVVTKDVPPGAIMVGNPGRVVGSASEWTGQPKPEPRLVELPVLPDDRGMLTFGQFGEHIPFVPRRYYSILDVPSGKLRGQHAHRRQHGFAVCLRGGFTITLDDGRATHDWRLDTPSRGLYIPPMYWNTLSDFTPDAVILCLASGEYDESDYIRDHAEFTALTRDA
jgi:dTDP-4-dehydrorhamnose 3,5-epimerase-like enzyme